MQNVILGLLPTQSYGTRRNFLGPHARNRSGIDYTLDRHQDRETGNLDKPRTSLTLSVGGEVSPEFGFRQRDRRRCWPQEKAQRAHAAARAHAAV